MKVRLEYMSFYLLIGILLPSIGFGDAFTCPEHCSCSEIQRKRYNYNHAKCTSLDGLRQLGKTSELHSLDLSTMNLTKINNQLDKLSNLSKLDLSDNHLSEISNLHQRRIRVLNISGNRITSGKLAKIPWTVKHLNLSHNDITILPEIFKRFVHLKSLELADNPLNCTCETLDIRNWLQERQVWTEKPIRCMAPLQFKGRSWLQIRQSEVCAPNGLETPRMLPFSDGTDDENDLLLGDDPNAGGDLDANEGIEKDFLPVKASERTKRTESLSDSYDDSFDGGDDFGDEGSGSEPEEKIVTKSDITTEAYEGSGDEDENTETPIVINDNDSADNETLSSEDENKSDETTDIVPLSLNSSENSSIESSNENETPAPVTEQPFIAVKSATNDAEFIENGEAATGKQTKQSDATKINNDEIHESNSTYILLAVLGILLVALILYVATKRSRTNTKNRRNNNDIESPAQELKPMDKNNLGKPIQNPVEFIPLIPEKHDPERKTNLYNGEEPLLQKLTEVENENETTDDGKQKADDKLPANGNAKQLNGNAKPIQNGVHPIDDNPTNDPQKQYQPISPKPSRYSPVYSHDTGRVKIKLSETSRPKTPILVTRSRSNAGDNKFDNTISQ